VSEESHREEMNEAIRAQRERGAVPRSMLPPEEPEQSAPPDASNSLLHAEEEAAPPPPARRGFMSRLLRRGRP
jgi:hypothetical protein